MGSSHDGAEEGLHGEHVNRIMENVPAGIITFDDTGHIRHCNRACAGIFGYEAGELAGKKFETLIPGEKLPETITENTVYVRGLRARRRTGEEIPVELRMAELLIAGRRFFACAIEDISARKASEDALRRSRDEMEQFAYIASHDLKAPLRGIDNLAQWIGDDLAPVMTPEAEKHLKMLRLRVGRIETLLNDILSYSRAGRIVEAGEKIDLRELLAQVAEPLFADGKFTLDVAENMPQVISPRTPLVQVFSNLIANAIKHHDKGTGIIRVSCADAGAFYEFSVSDDGPGIPPAQHERAFQMFQTLKPRDKAEGSGLGLAIVKKLVEWQGGTVRIVSPDGQRGTDVRFLWKKNSGTPMV